MRLIFIVIFAKNIESADENVAVFDDGNETMSHSYHQSTLLPVESVEAVSHIDMDTGLKINENNSSRQQKALLQTEDDYEDLMNTEAADTTPATVHVISHTYPETQIATDEETTEPTTKKAKQLEIYKTRPNELLRHYVEDTHLRPPIAALVDKKINPLTKARQLWKSAVRPAASNLEVMLVSYDSEGIRSIYNISNTKAMMTSLNRIREENATSEESKTFYSLLRTSQLVPYDSAIFLSTDNLPSDHEHQDAAAMNLLKKRIRLYLIIFDEKLFKLSENLSTAVRQTGFLGQLALRTGGDILYVPNNAFRTGDGGEMGLAEERSSSAYGHVRPQRAQIQI